MIVRAAELKSQALLPFVRELLIDYRSSHSLIKSAKKAQTVQPLPKSASQLLRKLDIAGLALQGDIEELENNDFRELFAILAFGIGSGADMGNALELFLARLEKENAMRNRLKAKMGGMQALTYMGMCVFFPIFSSVSGVILNSSLSLFGGGALRGAFGFMLICAAYIPITLFISTEFSHPERPSKRNAVAILPYAAFAFAVLYFVPSLLSSIL